MYSVCTLCVHGMYSACTLCVHSMYSLCTHCAHTMYSACTQCVPYVCTVCTQCALCVHTLCVQHVLSAYTVCTVGTQHVLSAYPVCAQYVLSIQHVLTLAPCPAAVPTVLSEVWPVERWLGTCHRIVWRHCPLCVEHPVGQIDIHYKTSIIHRHCITQHQSPGDITW